MMRLEELVQALGREWSQAQRVCGRCSPGTRVAALEVVMAATVERVDASGTLALRVGRAPVGRQKAHRLSIRLPGTDGHAATVGLDGELLGHYGEVNHAPAL